MAWKELGKTFQNYQIQIHRFSRRLPEIYWNKQPEAKSGRLYILNCPYVARVLKGFMECIKFQIN